MPAKGKNQSSEARRKISERLKGHGCSDETRELMSRNRRGKVLNGWAQAKIE